MGSKARDEFRMQVKEILAKRVGHRCSVPTCRQLTSGPHTDADKAMNLGVAGHITAASKGGPRYDVALTPAQRKSAENGIWLCQFCGKLVDNDATMYPKTLLLFWKSQAEAEALKEIEKSRKQSRPSDLQALEAYRAKFDRPAVQDRLACCNKFTDFNDALDDLISLINTGIVQRQTITKARNEFDNPKWKQLLEDLYHKTRGLREYYVEQVRAGRIDESRCNCQQLDIASKIDAKKWEITTSLNAILEEAKIPRIQTVILI